MTVGRCENPDRYSVVECSEALRPFSTTELLVTETGVVPPEAGIRGKSAN
ncbi:MAG TPA: hypothetical protein VKP30_29390 [Polyangiaceae bacterium]|nr:hypothetical protein [Polyangiaceae bacterium]